MSIHVVEGGPMTTVQDVPGRVGYWHVGVPPNGPMDDLAHRLVNRVLGNAAGAALLELTRSGPTLVFDADAVIAIGGAAMRAAVDGDPLPPFTPTAVRAGATVRVGAVEGAGLRATLGVRGGIDVAPYLGSRSTFTLGRFGGHEGRALQAGDVLRVGTDTETEPAPLPPGMAPALVHEWAIGVLVGPHGAPDFLTAAGVDALLRAEWEVHFNSARTGVRLIGPTPQWARPDGGDAGLHPSNIHDTGYAIGAVDLTGDMPIILGPDGPSLGGFVCPAVVAAGERWKLGQLAPGDRVRLVPWTAAEAERRDALRRTWLAGATARIEPLARPVWNERRHRSGGGGRARADTTGTTGTTGAAGADRPAGAASAGTGVLAVDHPDNGPVVTYRQAGDRFLLVEFGEMTLDLELRLHAHALDLWVREHLGPGLVDATAGVRSLLVQVDGDRLTVGRALDAMRSAHDEIEQLIDQPFPSRIVHLPLSWDDPATHEAIARYVHGVRDDAPWCPWNIEFIRRINGLDHVDDVQRTVFDASYLVLGLGDVYLGAPVATPLDPRHRLVTTKYNPARTWTAENSVGIGGAYLCIYGMEGPGGYQFVGRTVQVWNRDACGPHFDQPWLLRAFDQIRWYPVGAEELLELRERQDRGVLPLRIEDTTLRLEDQRRFLEDHAPSIEQFRTRQQDAFAEERRRWHESGEFDRNENGAR